MAKLMGNEVSLTWPNQEGVTYIVEYKTLLGVRDWTPLEGEWPTNKAIASQLSLGASYLFRVKAKNSCGVGFPSEYIRVDVPAPPRQAKRP